MSLADNIGSVITAIGQKIKGVQTLVDANAQAIANLATAQGSFGTTTPQIITTSEVILTFETIIPSTDTGIMTINDISDTISYIKDASYNFRTDMIFDVGTAQSRTITIRGRNVADNSLVYSRTVDINQANNTQKEVSSNTLLTLGKNGFPSAPLNIYFTIQADGVGITMHQFESIITSSNVAQNIVGGSGGLIRTTTLDFGNQAVPYKLFTINDANLGSGNKISGVLYTPKTTVVSTFLREAIDDDEFDEISFSVKNVTTGSFQLLVKSEGLINNLKTIQYIIQ